MEILFEAYNYLKDEITGSSGSLAETYPDLEANDLVLVKEYLKAYQHKDSQPERYQKAKSQILSRVKKLQAEFEAGGEDEKKQLKILGSLINFNQILRKTKVLPLYFMGPDYSAEPGLLQQSTIDGLAGDIPEEVKLALGEEFSEYVSQQVKQVFFVKHLDQEIKILGNCGAASGTCEGATRSVIIDTFSEKYNEDYTAWELAAFLVHEAAHIDYFYRFAGDPIKQDLNRVERYAYLVEQNYLEGLLVEASQDPKMNAEMVERISYALAEITLRIKELNQKLGFVPEDCWTLNN